MVLSQRQIVLFETERWTPLRRFVELWYAEPITEADGNTPDEIEAATSRLGRALPPALAEWFELVGNRLQPAGKESFVLPR